MQRWMLIVLLILGAHFAASYVIPLRHEDRATFGGLLAWVWPWGVGDQGFLGVQDGTNVPMAGFWVAMLAAAGFAAAGLALMGWLVPTGWWRVLAAVGAGALLVAAIGFLGWTKLLPIALAAGLLWIVFARVSVAGLPVR